MSYLLLSCILSEIITGIPFLCDGRLFLSHIVCIPQFSHAPVLPLARSAHLNASTVINDSFIHDLQVIQSIGTLVSSGLLSSLDLNRCYFKNVTITNSVFLNKIHSDRYITAVEVCHCISSVAENAESPFFGSIFPSSQFVSHFLCFNISFVRCYRNSTNSRSISLPLNQNQGDSNSEPLVYQSELYTSTQTLSSGKSYQFLTCNFTLCST